MNLSIKWISNKIYQLRSFKNLCWICFIIDSIQDIDLQMTQNHELWEQVKT